MNDHRSASLDVAKQEFVLLLSRLTPDESKDFFQWIMEQHSSLRSDQTSHNKQASLSSTFQECVNAEQSLQSIIEDLRGQLPISGICGSETMLKPEIGQVETINRLGW